MFYNLLANALKTRSVSIGEAALYAALGFAVVFVGIIFLIFVVWLVGKIMNANTQKVEKPIKEKPIKEEKVESLAVADATEDELSDEEVVIITAALMAYYEKNNPKCEFTVKRIKRI